MTAEWTWLVYMAGDNNLEGAGRGDLGEMQQVGSTDKINVLVQFDTEAQRTMRYRIERGRATTLQTMRGVDCGDPKVLTDFIQWGATKFPAKRYALVVWNHGGGWEDSDVDYEANKGLKPLRAKTHQRARRTLFRTTRDQVNAIASDDRLIAIDCGAQDYLDNQELRLALENSKLKIDLFGCDACLMNMVEIAYEMKDTASYMVGSEETEPGTGWPYTEILQQLVANPTMTPADLAKNVVTDYGEWYRKNSNPARDGVATQSALDLSKIDALAKAIDGFATLLKSQIGDIAPNIALARARSLQFELPDYIDLGDFAKQVQAALPNNSLIATSVKALLGALGDATLANETCGQSVARATGLSIFFPQGRSRLIPQYERLKFGQSNAWKDFLRSYAG